MAIATRNAATPAPIDARNQTCQMLKLEAAMIADVAACASAHGISATGNVDIKARMANPAISSKTAPAPPSSYQTWR